MNIKEINAEVLYTKEHITCINQKDIAILKERAMHNMSRKIRICCHKDINSSLHEMLIVHAKGSYIRPHRHINKNESLHIIEGLLDVVLFSEIGDVNQVIHMGERTTGFVFYYKLLSSRFHTVIPVSDMVVFHETTNGPYLRSETLYADWAPSYKSPQVGLTYINELSVSSYNLK